MNTVKTVLLMTLIMVMLILVGGMIGGQNGMIMAFAISLLLNFGSYWFSDKIVLAMYKAHQISESDNPRLYNMVARVASQTQLPMPKVFIIADDTPNAFATGRNPEHAAIAATEGIVRSLSDDELEGVIAHEFAHIKHRDILTGTIAATMVGAITFVARMAGWSMMFGGSRDDRRDSNGVGELALLIVAPIAAMLLQLAISRSREFAADAAAASFTGRPMSLATALSKLERSIDRKPMAQVTPSSAHLFIVNPLRGGGIMKLFATHPPIEERIERLQQIAMGNA